MRPGTRELGAALAIAMAMTLATPGLAPAQERAPVEPARPPRPSLLRPAMPDVLVNDQGPAEIGPERGVTIGRWGPVRVFGAPVVVESPAAGTPRPNGAVLPGLGVEIPWLP